MVKASLIIVIKNNKIEILGNEDLIWYIKEKNKDNNIITNILDTVVDFMKLKRKKGKMNIIVVGDISNYEELKEKYKDMLNIYYDKSVQRKIIDYI